MPAPLSQARRLISQEDAHMIAQNEIPRSRFYNTWSHKKTFDAGYLVPFLVDEILPGDHMRYEVTAFVRMQTPQMPMMDSQRIDTFFFFIPNRLVWENWARFMGEQDDPGDSVAFVIPQVVSPAGGFAAHSIADHFGLPTALAAGMTISVNALPFRAYNLVFNEWFRDQALINSLVVNKGDGPDTLSNYALRRRAKSADYFTSALPWPQRFTGPTIPLTGQAPVTGIGVTGGVTPTGGNPGSLTTQGASSGWPAYYNTGSMTWQIRAASTLSSALPEIYADLANVGGIDINALRQAFLVQQLYERDARGGTRYTEIVKSHFRVTVPDFRVQRPEFIGGGSAPLTITPIAQTTPTTDLPVGVLGAAATALGQHNASFAATEHGFILGLINVKSELSYQRGLHRMWSRQTRLDHYFPATAGLGEQAIYRKEIYAQGNSDDNLVFGYQERWHELRTRTSEVTGYFRSSATGTLDMWHLSQNFLSAPTLSQAFIEDDPPMFRVLSAGEETLNQMYLADISIRREATRPIPMFGTPVTLGRF